MACVFKNCPLCKARDDFINQLNIELMNDMLPLIEGPLTEGPVTEGPVTEGPVTESLDFVPLTQELDFDWDVDNEEINFD
jgi:hypothetical protein